MSMLELLKALLAVALPWLTGAAWARLIWRRDVAGRIPAILGYGFLLGMLSLVLSMLAVEAMGIRQGFLVTVVPLVAMTLVAVLLARGPVLAAESGYTPPLRWADLSPMMRGLGLALLALLVVRLGMLLPEVLLRPLYPWDAWMNWAPKARAWFEHGWMVPFVSRQEWLSGASEAGYYTMMNWNHPPGVPLVQLWVAMVVGRWDDALINLPWWFLGVALALAFYGQSRAAGFTPVAALLGAYLLVSLPLFASNVALAGYAELWIAGWMLLGALSLHQWAESGDWRHAGLVLVAVLALPLFKTPGLVWALILLAVALVARMRLRWLAAALVSLAAVLAVLAVTVGIDIELSRVGRIAIGLDGIALPYMRLDQGWTVFPVWGAVGEHLLVLGSWHLLWYLAPLVLVVGAWFSLTERGARSLWFVTVLGLAFLFVVFFLTQKHVDALDGTTLNRAILHLAPVLVILGTLLADRVLRTGEKPPAAAAAGGS